MKEDWTDDMDQQGPEHRRSRRSALATSRLQHRLCTWYLMPGLTLAFRMLVMLSAAFTGTVLFSTTILELLATSAIRRAQDSTNFRSAARPCGEGRQKCETHRQYDCK